MSEKILEPCQSGTVFGHQQAEAILLNAIKTQRMHHAWLFHGPPGIGKASLAYCVARYLFAQSEREASLPDDRLYIPPDHPVFRQVAAGGYPDLCVLSADGETGNPIQEIPVHDIRKIIDFFSLTASRKGWRIAIIDQANRLNINAANALLKILEEPPSHSLFILTAEMPSLLPATLRSRCQKLPFSSLGKEDFKKACQHSLVNQERTESMDFEALFVLSGGKPGQALGYVFDEGIEIRQTILHLLDKGVSFEHSEAIHALAERAGKNNTLLTVFRETLIDWMQTQIAGLAGEKAAPGIIETWLNLWENLHTLLTEGEQKHLSHAHIIFTVFFMIENSRHKKITRDKD